MFFLKKFFSSKENGENQTTLAKSEIKALEKYDINIPLILDLDGTLLKSDFLYETLFQYVKQNPFRFFKAVGWLISGGKVLLKEKLEKNVNYDVALFPANEKLVQLAQYESKRGRKIHLATASNINFAKKIAKRFDFISNIHASDDKINLKGANKAKELEKNYPQGFIYAGDSEADIAIWQKARALVIVGAKNSLIDKIKKIKSPDLIIKNNLSKTKTVTKALRIHQWAKNLLVFVPLFLSGAFIEPLNWLLALNGFFALSLLASATYLINDLWDLEDDRAHWSKRFRPIASGDLSIPNAVLLAVLLAMGAFILALILPFWAQILLALYLITTLLYSFLLKKLPIIDVATIAFLFVLRVAFGAYVINVAQSSWLLVFAMALFLSLSFAKRVVEVMRLNSHNRENTKGRGYLAQDSNILMIFGAASGLSSVIVMVMYIFNDAYNAQFYSAPIFLWAFPFILLIWVCHIWLICSRGELNDDPVIFALKDKTSLGLAAILPIIFILSWSAKTLFSILGA